MEIEKLIDEVGGIVPSLSTDTDVDELGEPVDIDTLRAFEAQVEAFVGHYNHQRYHESLGNLTPADVYFGRGQTILLKRERIKRKTIEHRRLQHRKDAA